MLELFSRKPGTLDFPEMQNSPLLLRPPIAGRGADKYLTDELGENLTIVVDGIDGRTHHLGGIDSARRAT
ncbi:hypothetical protein ASD00_35495 [Ensifer sp. Root31]|nr:hypothetical protein ASD00_35495 [Ensifer sp. Root31]